MRPLNFSTDQLIYQLSLSAMVLFCLFAAFQGGYAIYFFMRIFCLPVSKSSQVKEHFPVSIIICAKNEAANLKKNLPSILSQRYSNDAGKALYEVIVVNDDSDDDTSRVLMELEQQYDNLWDVVIAPDAVRDLQGKKYALSKGVAIAGHDWLLLTDADCIPAGPDWLATMVAPLAAGKQIVAGYGGYNHQPGLLNAFIRWETIHTFLQYSTYALAGIPYMAVGRNLACTKDVFLTVQQSEVWNALPSGDDDLLISIAGTSANTAIVCDEPAFTFSNAKTSWHDWVQQKQRHLSTGKYYKNPAKLLLGVYGISHAALWLCFFALLFSHHIMPVLVIMLVRCIIYWFLWTVTTIKLHEKKLIYLFPFCDIAWMVYNFAFFPYITWKNKKQWK